MANELEWEDYLGDEDEPYPHASDDDLIKLEQHLGFKLPQDYKQIVKEHQGQGPVPDGVPVGQGMTVFNCLFHVYLDGRDPVYGVASHYRNLVDEGFTALVPFASNGANARFCFDYRSHQDAPSVVLVDGDYGPGDPEVYVPLAATFTELLGQLKD